MILEKWQLWLSDMVFWGQLNQVFQGNVVLDQWLGVEDFNRNGRRICYLSSFVYGASKALAQWFLFVKPVLSLSNHDKLELGWRDLKERHESRILI